MSYNFVAECFDIEKNCSKISSRKVNFYGKRPILRFEPLQGAHEQRMLFILGSLESL